MKTSARKGKEQGAERLDACEGPGKSVPDRALAGKPQKLVMAD